MMTKNCPFSDCCFFPVDFIDDDCLTEYLSVCVCLYVYMQKPGTGRKRNKVLNPYLFGKLHRCMKYHWFCKIGPG